MKAEDIYHKLQEIVYPINAHDDQMVAIAKWIEAEFEYKPNKPSKPVFDNKDRNRYYGLRVGDLVSAKGLGNQEVCRGKVLELVPMDNNRVLIENNGGKPKEWIAEWCDIITKVEDL